VRRRIDPHEAETIVAIATPPGSGAIGVIRLSGPHSVAFATRLVRLTGAESLACIAPRRVLRASVIDPETREFLDTALVVKMIAPHSYTGEDVVEISCHGNAVLLGEIVRLLVSSGARLAEPGEFTRRAYLNAKLDLAQVEAVAELISARTERAVRLASRQLSGALSARITAQRERLLDVIAGLEVGLDFPEDEAGLSRPAAWRLVNEAREMLTSQMAAMRRARVVQQGVSMMLVGAPNVGKSSLFNVLAGTDRAIVSPSHGTTRDLVDVEVVIRGIVVRIRDGAGLGNARDSVDAEGMKRAREAALESDLALLVLDASRNLSEEDEAVLKLTDGRERIVVGNKADLDRGSLDPALLDCQCSALTGYGVPELQALLEKWIWRRTELDSEEGGIVASVRVLDALGRAVAALDHASMRIDEGAIETVLVDLLEAEEHLGRTLGTHTDEDILDRIFARFCIGK